MRWIAVGALLLGACSNKEEAAPEPSTRASAPVPVDAAPPPATEVDGIPVAVAMPSRYDRFSGIVMDGDRFYALATDVLAVAKTGGEVKTLIAVPVDESTATDVVKPSNEEDLRRMTADSPDVAEAMRGIKSMEYAKAYAEPVVRGGFLYMANAGTMARNNTDATIERIPVGGGKVEILANASDLPDGVDALQVDDASVYIVTRKSAILRMPIAGGAVTTIYPAPTSALGARHHVTEGGDSFFVSESTLDAEFAHKNATITRVPKAGGTATMIVPKLPASVSDLIADEAFVYWMDGNHKGVWRTDHAGKAKPKLVANGYGEDLHLHGKYLYRVVDDQLVRTLKAGGTEEKLHPIGKQTSIIAIDDTAVWLSSGRYILRLERH